jgi:hypothetical protein
MFVAFRTQASPEGLLVTDPKSRGQQLPRSGLMAQSCCDTGEPQRYCALQPWLFHEAIQRPLCLLAVAAG